jgi:hypothetical protein
MMRTTSASVIMNAGARQADRRQALPTDAAKAELNIIALS